MKVLITGITGFVGSYLKKELEDYGHEVFGTSRNENKDKCIYKWEMQNINEIREILYKIKPNVIIHLASQSSVHVSWKKPYYTMRVNILGTLNLLEEIQKEFKNTKLIFASSSEIYDITDFYIKEDEIPLNPRNPYSITKVANDDFIRLVSKINNLNTTILRLFNHTGPLQNDKFVIPNFAKQLMEIKLGIKEPILYVGNLEAKRDFTDVRDVVKAYRLMMNVNEQGGYYNVCSGRALSIREILDIMINLSGVNVEIKTDNERMRPSDLPVLVGDYTKIKNKIGWEPIIPLERTLNDMLNFYYEFLNEKK